MTARLVGIVTAVLVGLVAGCGGPPEQQKPTPVKTTPLTGTVDGQAWTPIAATARTQSFSDPGERWIDISATAFTCATFVPEAEIIGTVPWVTGTAYELSLARNLTIITHKPDGGIVNNIATNGRVEIVSAPDAGVGTIRIRASAGTGNRVEGQIDVSVCD